MSHSGGERSAADLRQLYQSVILEHNRTPRNRRRAEGETHRARGFNPLCGDDVTVSLTLSESGQVLDLGFEGKACAICTAAASCMTEVASQKHEEELKVLSARFEAALRGAQAWSEVGTEELLEAFQPVSGFPSRIKCAILPWRALSQALCGAEQTVTTEGL